MSDNAQQPLHKRVQEPQQLLEHIRLSQSSEAEVRKFAAATVRHVEDLLADTRSRKALFVAEHYANNNASEFDLKAARDAAGAALQAIRSRPPDDAVADFYQPEEAAAEAACALTAQRVWPLHKTGKSRLDFVVAAVGHAANAAAGRALVAAAKQLRSGNAECAETLAYSGKDEEIWRNARRTESRWQAELLREMFHDLIDDS